MAQNTMGTILVAEDDEDDRLFIRKAFSEIGFKYSLDFVDNGIDLIDYLDNQGRPSQARKSKLPSLVFLDLNMPLKDGRESLKEIRSNPNTNLLPVVVLTTSSNPDDIHLCYKLGADGYVTKPDRFEELKRCLKSVITYWCETVENPTG